MARCRSIHVAGMHPPKRHKQESTRSLLIDDEAALSGEDSGDEMEQVAETSDERAFLDDDSMMEVEGEAVEGPFHGDGVAVKKREDSRRNDAPSAALPHGWVSMASILELLPEDAGRPQWEQRVETVMVGGCEIAFLRGLTAKHNRSVEALARAIGMGMQSFLKAYIIMPILLQKKGKSFANWAVFHGTREEWIEAVLEILSHPVQYRAERLQPLCEMITNGTPLRLYFDT